MPTILGSTIPIIRDSETEKNWVHIEFTCGTIDR